MRGASRASRNRTAKTSLDEFKINRRKEESEVLRELCGETDEIGETRARRPGWSSTRRTESAWKMSSSS